MATSSLRIGIAGCGRVAREHLRPLLAVEGVRVVGCADPDLDAAAAFAALVPARPGEEAVPTYADHTELLKAGGVDALAIFTPHLLHYRPAMDALQADCHVFLDNPLSTRAQEATDIVGLARGRGRKVAVGHHFRLLPSLAEARRQLADGAIGPVRLVAATLAEPWLAELDPGRVRRRSDARLAGGLLADEGVHLLDALLWSTGRSALEVAAIQAKLDGGPDVVTAAAVRLDDGTPATLAFSGLSPSRRFELEFYGELGRLRVDESTLELSIADRPAQALPLGGSPQTIDANFAAAVLDDGPLCCPADQALETVRLLEAIVRSAVTGQLARLA